MRDDRGFTIVELSVVLLLISIVTAIGFSFLDNTTSVTSRVASDVETEQTAQWTLRTMTEDLRAATGIQPCASGTYKTCIVFDIPSSAKFGTRCPERRITYAMVGTALQQTRLDYTSACGLPATSTAVTILAGVQNGTSTAVFTYYDNNQNVIDAINAPASVPQAVEIAVTLRLSYATNVSVVLNLFSTASLRNNR